MGSAEGGHSSCKASAEFVFGKFSDAELVAKLKGLALDPRGSELSPSEFQDLLKQTTRVRDAMSVAPASSPRRKRALMLDSGADQQRKSKVSKNGSRAPPSLTTGGSEDRFDRRLGFEDDGMDCNVPPKNVISLPNSDESANSQNPASPENAISQKKKKKKRVPSNSPSQGTQTKKQCQPARRSARTRESIADESECERGVVPVGIRFQAELPEWIGPEKAQEIIYKHETSKWVSTRIWPCEGRRESIQRKPGKGRSDSCNHCYNPGSAECVQRHIIEDRLLLLCDLGSAFFRMRLDQHGEQISKLWPAEEQRTFQALATRKPMHEGTDFVKHALRSLPRRCRKEIMNYYFNVYLPRHMGQMTRASKQIDTDDEEEAKEVVETPDKKPERETGGGGGGSKNAKNRFLRQ